MWKRLVKATATGQTSFITTDPRFSGAKTLSWFKAELALRFPGRESTNSLFPLGLIVKYANGYMEPDYEHERVLTVGLAFCSP